LIQAAVGTGSIAIRDVVKPDTDVYRAALGSKYSYPTTGLSDTQQVPIVSTYYSGFGGWGWAGWGGAWGGPAWATTTVDYDLKAELVVTLIDASSAQAVWRGVSYGDISSKPEKASKKTAKNIGKMFEEYPPVTLFRN
jgi:hypothetical protein